ncbi:MAG: hypothetical protein JXR48_16855 [Candidatus Delongbacteria bacterium]|nr:hypothetical protein [Candidatus Delongbacteria bacterium]MBN2836628.1 hypothetical protein [Candidatus Delongbacteria bacterium]
MKYILLILIFSSLLFCADVSIKADRNSISIGERIKVELQISYDKEEKIYYKDLENASIGSFERISSEMVDKKDLGNRITEIWRGEYTSFEKEGKYFLGPIEIEVSKGEETDIVKSDSLEIEIISVLKSGSVTAIDSTGKQINIPLDSLQTVLPIKGVRKYNLSSEEKTLIFSIIGLVILTIVVIYLILKKKRTGTIKPVIKKREVPAHVVALEKLRILISKDLNGKGLYKEFSTEISTIVREYLEKRYKFTALELPTTDIMSKAEEFITDKALKEELESLLGITDMVKFAKHVLLADEMNGFVTTARDFIENTKESEQMKKEEVK